MILKTYFHEGSAMINEFLCVASITAKPAEGQTKSGRRTAQSVVLTDLDYDDAPA
jgi:hypothetical protein